MAIDKFVFNLTSEFHRVAMDEVFALCELHKHGPLKHDKYNLAFEAVNKMVDKKGVNQKELMAIALVVSEYRNSVVMGRKINPKDFDQDMVDHAKELMRFVDDLFRISGPLFNLKVVPND